MLSITSPAPLSPRDKPEKNLSGTALNGLLDMVRRHPDNGETRHSLARLLDTLNRRGEALRVLASCLYFNPSDRDALHRLSCWFEQAGDLDTASLLCKRLLQLSPDDTTVQQKASELLERGINRVTRFLSQSQSDCQKPPASYRPDSRVSIIIPSLNQPRLLASCLAAIVERTLKESYEIIVVDNDSDRETRNVLAGSAKRGDIRLVQNETNRGFAAACNQGMALARGEYVLVLNNDTVVLDNWFLPLVWHLQKNKQTGICGSCLLYPGTEIIQHAGVVIGCGKNELCPYHRFQYRQLPFVPEANCTQTVSAVTGACLMTRKDIINSVGKLDEAYCNGHEDIDWCFRVRRAGFDIVYCAESRVYHHESRTPGRDRWVEKNFLLLNKRWYNIIEPDESWNETHCRLREIGYRRHILASPENLADIALLYPASENPQGDGSSDDAECTMQQH